MRNINCWQLFFCCTMEDNCKLPPCKLLVCLNMEILNMFYAICRMHIHIPRVISQWTQDLKSIICYVLVIIKVTTNTVYKSVYFLFYMIAKGLTKKVTKQHEQWSFGYTQHFLHLSIKACWFFQLSHNPSWIHVSHKVNNIFI